MTSEILAYENPKNHLELKELLIKETSRDEILRNIQYLYPDWITDIFPDYSSDYPHLKNNWLHICKKLNTDPYKIINVKHIHMDVVNEYPHYDYKFEFLRDVCDILVSKGFVIRRPGELIGCRVCGKALPSSKLHQFMLDKKLPCPDYWEDKCTGC